MIIIIYHGSCHLRGMKRHHPCYYFHTCLFIISVRHHWNVDWKSAGMSIMILCQTHNPVSVGCMVNWNEQVVSWCCWITLTLLTYPLLQVISTERFEKLGRHDRDLVIAVVEISGKSFYVSKTIRTRWKHWSNDHRHAWVLQVYVWFAKKLYNSCVRTVAPCSLKSPLPHVILLSFLIRVKVRFGRQRYTPVAPAPSKIQRKATPNFWGNERTERDVQ